MQATVPGATTDSPPSVPELVRWVQAGRPGSIGSLVTACRPLIAGFAHRHLANRADVDEVVQEVSLKLVLHADRIRNPDAVRGWLRQVTRNEAITLRRRSSRAVLCDAFDDVVGEDCTEDAAMAAARRGEIRTAVGEALSRLRPNELTLVGLLFASDAPSYRAIGQQTGRPPGSIGPTRQRLLGRLRADPSVASLVREASARVEVPAAA